MSRIQLFATDLVADLRIGCLRIEQPDL
jgi:hypothetical protein